MDYFIKYIKNNRNMILILLFVVILTPIYFYFAASNKDVFSSPDENTMFYFTKIYKDSPSLKIDYKYNKDLTYGAVKPRGTIVLDNKIVPVLSNGMIISNGIFQLFLPQIFLFFFTPLFFSISVLFYYKLVTHLYNASISLISTIEYATLAPFIYFATKPMVLDIAALSSLVVGFYYFITGSNRSIKGVLSGFFLGYSIFFNHKYLFLIASLFLAYTILVIYNMLKTFSIVNTITANFKFYISLLLGLLPSIFMIGYTNFSLYGSPLRDGYVAQSALNKAIGGVKVPIFYIAFDKIYSNINTYFINILSPVFIVLTILALIYKIKNKQISSREKTTYFIFIFIISVISFTYFASVATWGYNINAISASFVRYLLPLYTLLIPLFIYALTKFNRPIMSLLVLLLVNLFSILYFLNSQGGYISTMQYANSASNIRGEVLSRTKPSDLILTQSYDKILFPYRETVELGALPVTYKNNIAYTNKDAVLNIINYFSDKKSSIFLIDDIDYNLYIGIKKSLKNYGYKTEEEVLPSRLTILKINK